MRVGRTGMCVLTPPTRVVRVSANANGGCARDARRCVGGVACSVAHALALNVFFIYSIPGVAIHMVAPMHPWEVLGFDEGEESSIDADPESDQTAAAAILVSELMALHMGSSTPAPRRCALCYWA